VQGMRLARVIMAGFLFQWEEVTSSAGEITMACPGREGPLVHRIHCPGARLECTDLEVIKAGLFASFSSSNVPWLQCS
jgi:hypothetical protein